MDTLQELPVDQWPVLQEKLKALWPLNASGYYALQTNFKHPRIREAFQFKVYCPYGDMDNGFIATSVKDGKELIIFCTDEDTNKFEEALANTMIINWSHKVTIGMASSLVIRLMENLKARMRFGTFLVWGVKTFFLDKSSKLFDDMKCPPNTYVAAVNPDDIMQVDEAWPFRYPTSPSYFSTIISNGFSYGLYSLDNKLLAWIFLSENNFLCHLHCIESHRRRGYGEFLLKTVVNDRLKRGNDVYGYVVPGNQKAMDLFIKLGFQHIDDGAWINVGV